MLNKNGHSLEGLFTGRNDVEADAPILCHLMQRPNSLEKTPILGNIESRRRSGQQRMKRLDGILDLTDMSLNKLRETAKDKEAGHAVVHGVTSNWT